ncbi:hypothetical protein YC2023_058611 [Brassica napus]
MVLPFYVGRMVYEGEYLTIDGCRTLLFSVALVFYAISFGMKGGQSYHHLLWLATFVFSIFCRMTSRHCTTIVVSSILPHFRFYTQVWGSNPRLCNFLQITGNPCFKFRRERFIKQLCRLRKKDLQGIFNMVQVNLVLLNPSEYTISTFLPYFTDLKTNFIRFDSKRSPRRVGIFNPDENSFTSIIEVTSASRKSALRGISRFVLIVRGGCNFKEKVETWLELVLKLP